MTERAERPPRNLLLVAWYLVVWRAWWLAVSVGGGPTLISSAYVRVVVINAIGLIGAIALVRGRRWGFVLCAVTTLYNLYVGGHLVAIYLSTPREDVSYLLGGLFVLVLGVALPWILLFWPSSWRWFRSQPSASATARA